jgi:hypothetical protein
LRGAEAAEADIDRLSGGAGRDAKKKRQRRYSLHFS